MAIARWVGAMDTNRVQAVLNGAVDPEDLDTIYEAPMEPAGQALDAPYPASANSPVAIQKSMA
jgi:hypothetical protein